MTKTHITIQNAALCGAERPTHVLGVAAAPTLGDSKEVSRHHTSICQRCMTSFTKLRHDARVAAA